MDIKEIIAAKHQCESEIAAIINMFMRKTGCFVNHIDFRNISRIGYAREISVRMDVGLDDV